MDTHFIFSHSSEKILDISEDGFYVRGVKVEQGEGEAKEVYDAFTYWLNGTQCIPTERNRCLRIVREEPELHGDMPDDMWELIKDDRDAITRAMRGVVKVTKDSICRKIENTQI